MCASPLSLLRSGPPPPKVALLPDALFFTRAVPIVAGTPAAEVSGQIELALEAISPFPLPQLYYGYHWVEGAGHALVYAAYRRRFTSEQTADWAGAELIFPRFAAVFGTPVKPATTVVLAGEDGFTAVHWESGPVPVSVTFQFLPPVPEGTEEDPAKREADRVRAREELLAALGGTRTVIDLAEPPVVQPADDKEIAFASGPLVSTFPAAALVTLDVRDKTELAQLGRAKRRDLLLWRVLAGSVAALGLLLLGEIGLVAGRDFWLQARKLTVTAQEPLVKKITDAQSLAQRIDELRTQLLLPFEMINVVNEKRPPDIWFTGVSTVNGSAGLYTLRVDLRTTNPSLIPVYEASLRAQPEYEKVDVSPPRTVTNGTEFTITVTFKPKALKPLEA